MYFAPEETVVLVTGNTLDFCDGSALAESLVDEVSRFHHPGVKVTVLPTLDEFNATYVVPRLALQSKLREALAAHDGSALDLHAWAVSNLPSLLRDEDYIIQATHGLEPEHARCYVCAVDTIDDVRVTEGQGNVAQAKTGLCLRKGRCCALPGRGLGAVLHAPRDSGASWFRLRAVLVSLVERNREPDRSLQPRPRRRRVRPDSW